MTDAAGQLTPVEKAASGSARVAVPVPSPESHARSDRALDEAPSWPVTRLVSWSLTLALVLSMLLPVAANRGVGIGCLVLLLPALFVALGARALFEAVDLATPSRRRRVSGYVLAVLPSAMIATVLMAAASMIVGVKWSPVVAGATVIGAALTLATAALARALEMRVRLGLRRVYFVGGLESQRDLASELHRRADVGLVGSSIVTGPSLALTPDGLVDAVISSRATVLVADAFAMRVPDLVKAASKLNLAGVRVRDLVSHYESEFKKVPLAEISPTWFLFDIASIHRHGAYRACRRAVDLTLAAALLAVSMPLIVGAAVWIKLTSPGPALYLQRRIGKDGVEFTLVKLRTMILASDPNATAAWAPSERGRVTPIGSVLRRFRIDELPQLWNVIRGDLALVGPRPEQVAIVERLTDELPHYSARHCIRPGITGWAQVNLGYGGSVDGTIAKLQRDLYYVKHQGLRLDALIIWLTLRAVLAGRG